MTETETEQSPRIAPYRSLTQHDPWLEQAPLVENALAAGTLKLVFVVGMARSGTTWVRHLLAEHPAVEVLPNETHLFSEYLKGVPRARSGLEEGGSGLRRILPVEDERRAWRALVLRLLLAGLPDWSSRRAVVEKTPAHIHFASFIHELLPEAQFVYVLRDPRAVVASWKAAAASTFGSEWASGGNILVANSWLGDIAALRRFEQQTERLRVVRYEQLHADGVETLFGLLTWLGLEATPETCAAYLEACRFDKLRASGWPDFFRKGRPDRWHEDLSRREIARIEGVAGPLMDELGYSRSRRVRWPLPSLWLYRASRWLERGSGRLAKRMRV